MTHSEYAEANRAFASFRNTYVGVPYAKDSETSKEAATTMIPHAPSIRDKVYQEIFDSDGVTCDDIERVLDLRHQTASARVYELQKAGRIFAKGFKLTRSGRKAQCWFACEMFPF